MKTVKMLIGYLLTASAVSIIIFVAGIVVANGLFPESSSFVPCLMGVVGTFIVVMTSTKKCPYWKYEIPILTITISNFLATSIISLREIILFSKDGIALMNPFSIIGVLIASVLIGRIFVNLNLHSGTKLDNSTNYPDMREKNSNSNMLAVIITFGCLLTFIELILWSSI